MNVSAFRPTHHPDALAATISPGVRRRLDLEEADPSR